MADKPKVRVCKVCKAGIPIYSPLDTCYWCYRKSKAPKIAEDVKTLKKKIAIKKPSPLKKKTKLR